MKITRRVIALIIMLTLCFTTAVSAVAAADSPSDWAKAEVEEALKLGFIFSSKMNSNYQNPITRIEFAETAVNFVVIQYNLNFISLWRTYEYTHDDYVSKAPFTDCDNAYVNLAYNLGIAKGRGDGTFDPDAPITRQEAAVMLVRAYNAYGGKVNGNITGQEYSDKSSIAEWAQYSVSLMSHWKVMSGMGDGSFAPDETYTREQCYITFLRLYKNATTSRLNKNVPPLLTPEEFVDYLTRGNYEVVYKLETDDYLVVCKKSAEHDDGEYYFFIYVIFLNGEGGYTLDLKIDAHLEDFELDDNGYILHCKLVSATETKEAYVDLRTCTIVEK